jgi:hypothetical protein
MGESGDNVTEGRQWLIAEISEVDFEVQVLTDAHDEFHEPERIEDLQLDQIEIFFDGIHGEAAFEQSALEVLQHRRSDSISLEFCLQIHVVFRHEYRSGSSSRDLEDIPAERFDAEVFEAPECCAEAVYPRLDV